MSKELIRYGCDDNDARIDNMLAQRLICSFGEDERSAPLIVQLYNKRLMERGVIPNFSDVFSDIEEYNRHIFHEGAIMKFEAIHGLDTAILIKDSGNEIFELTKLYEEDSDTYGNTVNLEFYVEYVLSVNKLSCFIEPEDAVFNIDGIVNIKQMKDVKVVINDGQSLLFPEFVLESVTGYGDFANYYKQENGVNVLMIGGV